MDKWKYCLFLKKILNISSTMDFKDVLNLSITQLIKFKTYILNQNIRGLNLSFSYIVES